MNVSDIGKNVQNGRRTSLPKNTKPAGPQRGNFKKRAGTSQNSDIPSQRLNKFFSSLIETPAIICNIPRLDNNPFEEFHKRLRGHQDEKEVWKDVLGGIPMSAKLQDMCGNTSQQQYYHNLSARNWAAAVIGRFDPGNLLGSEFGFSEGDPIQEIMSIIDQDNTFGPKTIDQSSTLRDESIEKKYWGRRLFELGKKRGITIAANTARAPIATIIQVRPEGLEEYIAHDVLNSPLQERFGVSIDAQLEGAKTSRVIALNSSFDHTPGEPTKLSAKVIRLAKLYEFLESQNGPKVNGKTFLESFLSLVNENGASTFEQKGLPRYILDTYAACGEVYFPNYLQLVKLKKECLDDRDKNKVTEKKAWENFSEKVIDNVERGIDLWKEIDRLKKLNPDSEELKKKRLEAYEHIRLTGADKPAPDGCPGYYKMLKERPWAFFQKANENILLAPTVHHYDIHGTPIKGPQDTTFGDLTLKLLRDYSNLPEVRRQVARLNKEPVVNNGNGNKELHKDIEKFIDDGIEIFVKKGIRGYLEWRMLKHLEHHHSMKEKSDLEKITGASGGKIFYCTDKNIMFSEQFIQRGKSEFEKGGIENYINFLKNELQGTAGKVRGLADILETFLPGEGNKLDLNKINALTLSLEPVWSLTNQIETQEKCFGQEADPAKKEECKKIIGRLRAELESLACASINNLKLQNEEFFYPNEMFSINNTLYDRSYFFGSIINVVLKKSDLNPDGQYYVELQPAREKQSGLPDFQEIINKNIRVHVAGDSAADIGMIASCLERGGFVDIIFNLIQDDDVMREIIRQRCAYTKEFAGREELFDKCRKKFGTDFYGLELLPERDKLSGEFKFKKIIGFRNCKPVYEEGEILENKIIGELNKKYKSKIIHNVSPEAFIRRLYEVFEALNKEKKEFDPSQLKNQGNKEYDWARVEKKESDHLPPDAPRHNIYHEWKGKDTQGEFVVYRSHKANGSLVLDRLNGKPPELFTGDLNSLGKPTEIYLNNKGLFAYQCFDEKEEKIYENLDRLNDHVAESKYLLQPSPAKKSALSKSFICNLPQIFHNLLKYSGIVMAAGGLVRLASVLSGTLSESTYKAGYWLSNGFRAISAVGGALRGELNVHKYHNIAFGEAINVISSFMPNGLKHMGLGLGNFILFLGRGQQRAQLMQRTNNHPLVEIKANKRFKNFIDPRPYTREITRIATGWICKVKNEVIKQGRSALTGELMGNLLSAIDTPIQMIKDIFKQPKLIFQRVKRISEKSGADYKPVPSAGHLLTLVGALSGISAILAGTVGRLAKIGEVTESGFNWIGSWTIAAANAIPAIGIMANAKEVMANPDGLPTMYRNLKGEDDRYNPKRAGLSQYTAGIGFGLVPWFNLENKYIASLFDMINGLYFVGASEEEKINTHILGKNLLRKRGEYYKPEARQNIIDFSQAA